MPFGGLDENSPLLPYETVAIDFIWTVSAYENCDEKIRNIIDRNIFLLNYFCTLLPFFYKVISLLTLFKNFPKSI